MNPPESDVLNIELHAVNEEVELGFFACLTINRPDKMNALNSEVMDDLKTMCAWVERRDDVRCLVVTGAPPNEPPEGKRAKPHAFVAGADITEFAGAGSETIRVKFADNAVETLWNLSKPTIAMVHGTVRPATHRAMLVQERSARSRAYHGSACSGTMAGHVPLLGYHGKVPS